MAHFPQNALLTHFEQTKNFPQKTGSATQYANLEND